MPVPARITLVGYRACGKSSVGRLLAARLTWPFVDADHALEERLGMSIREFIQHQGETPFRNAEETCLAELLAAPGPQILATGGGAVLRAVNRERLRAQGGLVAYLHAPAATLVARLAHNDGGRPSLTGRGVAVEVPELLAQRDPLYREVAGVVIDATIGMAAVSERLAEMVEG
jgi:shikimate kinase